jgi:WD40 repeat protein
MTRHIVSLLIVLTSTIPALAQNPPPTPNSPFGHSLLAKKPDEQPAHVLRRIGTPRMCQPGGVASIAVSPDGRWMATGDRAMTNQVYLWDLKTGRPRFILQGHAQWIARLEFSPDGAYLLASHHADTIHDSEPAEMVVWEVDTGRVAKYYQPTDWSLAGDGKTLATGRPNLDPDNRTLAIRYKGFTVEVADFTGQKLRRSITHPARTIQSVALSPDGSLLAVGTPSEVLLYDTTTGKELPGIKGLKERVHLLRFSPDGKTLASVSDDLLPADVPRSVELWELKTGKRIGTLSLDKGWPLRHLEFVPGGNLLTQRFLGEYQLWDLETQRATRTFKGGVVTLFDRGQSVAHNYDPKYGWAGQIYFEELASGKPLPIQGSGASLLPWKFSQDGKTVFTRTREKTGEAELVQAWDVATGKEIPDQRRREKHLKPQSLMDKANHDLGDGREVRYNWKEHSFTIVDTKTSRELYSHKVTGFPAWSVSPDQKRLAVFENSFDRRIRVIDLATFKDVASIPLSVSQSISDYLFSPDGFSLAVTDHQGQMRLYEARTGKLRLERAAVGPVLFSPDSRMMATSNLVGTIDLVDLEE